MTPFFIAGTRPNSLTSESGLFLTDFSVDGKRDYQDVTGVYAAGSAPQTLYTEGYNYRSEIKFTGTPIPTAGGALQGIAAIEDAAIITSLANLVDGEVFGITLSQGTIQSRDPSLKKARSGTGREFTFNLMHFPWME